MGFSAIPQLGSPSLSFRCSEDSGTGIEFSGFQLVTHAVIIIKWWSESSKDPWYHPPPLKETECCPFDLFYLPSFTVISLGHFCGTEWLWGTVIIFLLWMETSFLEKKKNLPQAGNISEKKKKKRVSFTSCSLQLPSLDKFQSLHSFFPVSGPLPVSFMQHPSPPPSPLAPLLWCTLPYLLPAANALLSPVPPWPPLPLWLCHAPLLLFSSQLVIPVVSALPLCEPPFLLLCAESL